MRLWTYILAAGCLLTLTAEQAHAQTQCRYYLANQSDTNQGLALSLEAPASSTGGCSLTAVNIILSVGDGAANHRLSVSQSWQTGVVYTAKAVITAAGPQQLFLNGTPLGTVQGAFKPVQGTFFGSQRGPAQGTPSYAVTQISVQVTSGSNSLSFAPNGANAIPLQLVLLAGTAPWPLAFSADPTQTTTITATFRFDALVSSPHQFDPYIDAYGQATYGIWPSKASADSDLQAAISEEQTWLANNGPLAGADIYGGSTLAGWTDTATNYYHTAFHNHRWWLISPLGNPLFYIGLSGIYPGITPITGRESMFAQLPPQSGEFAPAYSQNDNGETQSTTYISFDTANRIRKYGSSWRDAQNTLTRQRLSSWAFAGSGKWTHPQQGLAVNPVLRHDAVPNVTTNGHPDIFDPSIVSQLKATLTSQIGSNVTNPYIIGWSVGNEKDEIVQDLGSAGDSDAGRVRAGQEGAGGPRSVQHLRRKCQRAGHCLEDLSLLRGRSICGQTNAAGRGS